MALDADQQEQLSAAKAFAERYGNWIVAISLLIIAGAAANWGWRWYTQREAAAAASLYEDFAKAMSAKDGTKDSAKARELAATLMQQHAATAYASFAALMQARANFDAGDKLAAKAQLQWVVDHARTPEIATLARVRLAGVLLDEHAYDAGLALLAADEPGPLAAEVADRRGDLLLAQGKTAAARAAYAKAIAQAGPQDPLLPLIQSKLDALPAAS